MKQALTGTVLGAVLSIGTPAANALAPPLQDGCRIDAQGDPPVQYLWGGEARAVCVRQVGSEERVWVAEDGGRIRYSNDAGDTWTYQDTPGEAAQTLLDLWFLPDGERGWACGKGGRVLKTTNHGEDWTLLADGSCGHPNAICDADGLPAFLWGVVFLNDDEGFVAGHKTFKVTTDGGATWCDVELRDAEVGGNPLPIDFFELYRFDVIETGSAFIGNLVGEWRTPFGSRGIVFHNEWTSLADCTAGGGPEVWYLTFESTAFPEPWDVDFEATPLVGDEYRGYLVGGEGSGPGTFWRSDESGRLGTWVQEFETGAPGCNGAMTPEPGTLYGVATVGGGDAFAVGYGGALYWRDPALPGLNVWVPVCAPGFTAPLLGIDGKGAGDYWAVGSFGFQRRKAAGVPGWVIKNPPFVGTAVESLWRLDDLFFRTATEGWTCGQFQRIAKTIDGGCTWTEKYVASGNLSDIVFGSASEGVAGGAGGAVLFTTDGGESWSPATLPAGVSPNVQDLDHGAGSEYWLIGKAGGNQVILRSGDGGATWVTQNVPGGNVVLNGIDFLNGQHGFVVGVENGNVAKAWIAIDTGTDINILDVSPPPLPDPTVEPRGLQAVASGGNSIFLDDVYAVGRGGMVVRWSRPAGRFIGVPVVYNLQSDGSVNGQLSHQCLLSVGVAPGGSDVLIGAMQEPEESQDAGLGLRFDGTDWKVVKVATAKRLRAVSMVSPTKGYALARPPSGGAVTCAEGVGTSNMNDSTILLYDTGP